MVDMVKQIGRQYGLKLKKYHFGTKFKHSIEELTHSTAKYQKDIFTLDASC